MEVLVGILLGICVTQGGLIWHKLGKLETGLADLCREVRLNGKNNQGGENHAKR